MDPVLFKESLPQLLHKLSFYTDKNVDSVITGNELATFVYLLIDSESFILRSRLSEMTSEEIYKDHLDGIKSINIMLNNQIVQFNFDQFV